MAMINFKVVSPERVAFEEQVTQVTLPTQMGQITVLPNHVPIVATLIPGEIILTSEKGVQHLLAVSGGFVQFALNQMVVLADTAEMAHELSEERALEAHARAHELLKAKAGRHDREYATLQALMDKELTRLKVARKYKARRVPPETIQ